MAIEKPYTYVIRYMAFLWDKAKQFPFWVRTKSDRGVGWVPTGILSWSLLLPLM
jgi:hypothetical protein